MTRKDYELLAQAVRDALYDPSVQPSTECQRAVRLVACHIADDLADDNDRFDRERFLKACGVQS